MYVWTRAAPVHAPTPLLTHLAGEFADRIAAAWPQPHAEFVTAPTERRHLACLALTQGATPDETVLAAPLKKAIRALPKEAPQGLLRALPRLGEIAWAESDYRLLLDVLGEPEAAKLVRHAKVIEATHIRSIAGMPKPLLRAGVGRHRLNRHQAVLVTEAYEAIARRDGEDAAARVALRWGAAGTVKALFAALRDDILPEVATPPFPGTDKLRPLSTKAAFRDAATRYANCLKGEIDNAVDGTSAYYEWLGEPAAVIEINRDRLMGWRLEQARLARNATVPKPVRAEIVAELESMGVRVGRTYWDFENGGRKATSPGFTLETMEEAIAWCFGD